MTWNLIEEQKHHVRLLQAINYTALRQFNLPRTDAEAPLSLHTDPQLPGTRHAVIRLLQAINYPALSP